MDAPAQVPDDEVILRRVPPGPTWQAPGPRVTSANFHLRPGETGVSVTRFGITGPLRLLELGGCKSEDGWRVAAAQVSAVRKLGLFVVPKVRPEDSGHAEIESGTADLNDREVRRALAKLFGFVDLPATPSPPTPTERPKDQKELSDSSPGDS